MTLAELNNLLQINDGNLRLTSVSLPDCHFSDLLEEYNQGNDLVINKAEKTVSDNDITVTGTSSFLNSENLPLTAIFSIDSSGNPLAYIRYTLVGKSRNNWKFSQNFTTLPAFYFSSPQSDFLDSLVLTDSYYVLCTGEVKDPYNGEQLSRGLNFYSDFDPLNIVGVFNSVFNKSKTFILKGQIHIPNDQQNIPPVPNQEFPWDMSDPVPGINLSADIGIDIAISDKLKLTNTKIRIYSPITSEWLLKNNSYQPIASIEGELAIPSLNVNVTVNAYLNPEKKITTIIGSFDGVSFKNLLELTDLANGDGLAQVLPSDIQKGIKTLEKLTLEKASITIKNDLSSLGITSISLVVGLPGLAWSPIGSSFIVSDIDSEFIIINPFQAGRNVSLALKATLTVANAPFSVLLRAPDFMLTAELQHNTTLSLTDTFKTYLQDLPAPPDLTINDMSFSSDLSQGSFNFDMTMADDPAWTLSVPKPLTIFDVRAEVSKGTEAKAAFSGSLEFAKNVISVSYNTPGDFMIRGDFPKINVTDLISELCDNTIKFPKGFDIELLDSTILIQKVQSQDTFFFATQVDSYGAFLFQAVRDSGKTGLAFGFQLGSKALNSINGLSILKPLEDIFQLSDLMLLVTSVDPSAITFPDLDKFQNPNIKAKKISIPSQTGNNNGFYAYANVVFGSNGGQGTLSKLFGLSGQLGMVLFIGENPAKNAKFFINLDFKGSSGVLNGCTINAQLGALIANGEPGLFLLGNLTTSFGSQKVIFTLELLIVPNGAFISGTLQGSTPSFHLTDSLSITFSQLALEVGIDLEGIPSFGFTGQIDTSNGFDSSIAVFFDSADPAKSLLAGAVSDISLFDVVSVFSKNIREDLPGWLKDILKSIAVKGMNAFSIDKSYSSALDDLDLEKISSAFAAHGITVSKNIQESLLVVNTRGSIWSLAIMDKNNGITHYQLKLNGNKIDVNLEAQLYLAPQNTAIGSIMFPQGFKAIGNVSIFVLQLQSNTEIFPDKGIKINEEINSINWNVAGIDLFKITSASGSGNPVLSMSTFTDNTQKNDDLKNPHFLIDGKVSFLDINGISIYVNIRKEGINFEIKDKYFLVDVDVQGNFTKLDDFSVSGSAVVGITELNLGAAGTIPINTNIKSSLGIAVTTISQNLTLNANASLTVEILGDSFNLVDVTISISQSFFKSLPDTIGKLLIDAILKEPLKWLNWVKNGLITIAGDVVQVLKDIFKVVSWKNICDLMQQVGYAFSEIVKSIVHVFGIAAIDVWNYLISIAENCAIDAVNHLTGSANHYTLFEYSQSFLSTLGGTEDAQRLLFLYYNNQESLQNSLMINAEIWNEFIAPDNQKLLQIKPAETTIIYLNKIKSVSPHMSKDIDEVISILAEYEHLEVDIFIEKLN